MRLKSLQLQGFKSFADKTLFEFHPGVTGVVGPNGCGKSNVVDAIRWVLGETSAKALRGGEMADVIFNGTDKRQPLGLAEVSLTLSDCEEQLGTDYNEVSITRRVFRDGKSEYRINNQLCRLKDINELLMDTGMGQAAYSIMEQGKIDLLLSSKPEDRRAVFEEAAGITKYKTQKREALRKLDYTEANLVRIADIIAEVKRQMGSLQRQASKARRYQALLKDVKVLDTHYSHRRFEELQAERSELQTSVDSLLRHQQELQQTIARGESGMGTARSEFQELEEKINMTRQQSAEFQNHIQSAKSRIGFNAERARELQALIAQNDGDITTTSGRLSEQKTELDTAHETLERSVETITRQQEQFDEQTKKSVAAGEERQALDSALKQLRRLSSETESVILSVKAELSSNLNRLENDGQRQEQLSTELAKLETERNARTDERDKLKSELETARNAISEQTEAIQSTELDFQKEEAGLAELRGRLANVHRELTQKESRLNVLKSLIAKGEGLQKGTQAVLNGLDDPGTYEPGIRGVLTSFIEVEQTYIPALEAAIGPHLQTVLVSDSGMATAVIDTLNSKKLGEAALLPLELSPTPFDAQTQAVPAGATAWAIDKISVKSAFKPFIEKILTNVLIVPNIHTALQLKETYGDLAFVTLNGEMISAEGVLRGGTGGEDSTSLLRIQAEVRELGESTAALQAKQDNLNNTITDTQNLVTRLKTSLEQARSTLQESRVQESTLDGQTALIDREIQQMASKLEGVQWEQGELFKRQESAKSEVASLQKRQEETQTQLQGRLTEIREREAQLAELTRNETEVNELLNHLRTSLAVEKRSAETLRQQQAPMTHRLKELEELIGRRQTEIQTYREKISGGTEESEQLEKTISDHQETIQALQETLANLEAERRDRDGALKKSEQKLLSSRRELSTTSEQRGNEEIKITRLDLRIESLASAVMERYGVELESFKVDAHLLLTAIDDQKKSRDRKAKRQATMEAKNTPDEEASNGQEIDGHLPQEEEPAAEADTREEDGQPEEELILGPEAGPDWAFVEKVVGELKRKLDSMGPVNLDAIEEFEELEERYNFLEREHNDLVNSKAELLQIIAKINKTTKEMFSETFGQVRENFKRTFRELFGDRSRSDLILVDEDDPLESGIEIIARPPGKKPTSISLLSGGERSMTAVALLFSIYMVKPSPFCVLDELDAPLDESNIGRFLKMLDRFIDQSQFVIVTHNKRTMSRADVMYGVTMEEYGISKPLGMKLTSGDKKADSATTSGVAGEEKMTASTT